MDIEYDKYDKKVRLLLCETSSSMMPRTALDKSFGFYSEKWDRSEDV